MDFFALASKIIQTNDQGPKPRYKNSVDLKYPFNNLEKTDVSNDKLLVFTTIFSLAGVLGVLPLPIREELLKRHREKDDSLRDFIDIFNSRAIDFLVAIQGKRTFRINSSIHSKLGSLGSVLQSIVGFYNYGEEQNSYVGASKGPESPVPGVFLMDDQPRFELVPSCKKPNTGGIIWLLPEDVTSLASWMECTKKAL